jgi:hypothetical protein
LIALRPLLSIPLSDRLHFLIKIGRVTAGLDPQQRAQQRTQLRSELCAKLSAGLPASFWVQHAPGHPLWLQHPFGRLSPNVAAKQQPPHVPNLRVSRRVCGPDSTTERLLQLWHERGRLADCKGFTLGSKPQNPGSFTEIPGPHSRQQILSSSSRILNPES